MEVSWQIAQANEIGILWKFWQIMEHNINAFYYVIANCLIPLKSCDCDDLISEIFQDI